MSEQINRRDPGKRVFLSPERPKLTLVAPQVPSRPELGALTKQPNGLGCTEDQLALLVRETRKSVEDRADVAQPLTKHGEMGNGRSRDNNIISTQGTSADYLTARIARDNPDILKRMKAGEFVKPSQKVKEMLRELSRRHTTTRDTDTPDAA